MSENVAANDCEIVIDVTGGKLDGQEVRLDGFLVKVTAEQLYDKHKMEIVDGQMRPTAGFAKELSDEMEKLGYSCTPAVAVNAWVHACSWWDDIQKKTN